MAGVWGALCHFLSSPAFGSLGKVLDSELHAALNKSLPLSDSWFPNYKDGIKGEALSAQPTGWHTARGAGVLFVWPPNTPPHFANIPRGECCLPGPIPETQSLHFFAARMQSHGQNSPNQTPPGERRIQNGASAVAAVFKVS